MKCRPLPVMQEIAQLAVTDPEKAAQYQTALAAELFQHRGFQLVLTILHNLEHETLNALRSSAPTRPDFLLGRLNAIDYIQRSLVALAPDGQEDVEGEEEVELPVYESPFLVPYPISGERQPSS